MRIPPLKIKIMIESNLSEIQNLSTEIGVSYTKSAAHRQSCPSLSRREHRVTRDKKTQRAWLLV